MSAKTRTEKLSAILREDCTETTVKGLMALPVLSTMSSSLAA